MANFSKLKKKLKKKLKSIRTKVFLALFPVQKKKVLFVSDVRTVMGGNLKSVYDYLEGKDYKRVVEFRMDRRIKRNKWEEFRLKFHLLTSKYILLDDFCGAISKLKVRKGQELVQLWHGPGAFKKFGFSRLNNGEGIKSIHTGYKKYTKATVSGQGITWCYAEAFSISEDKVKATGFPRTDDFFDENYIKEAKERIYSAHPELKEKKIILFAPTYRGVTVNDASYDLTQLDLKELYDAFHEEYIFVIKWHPAYYNNIALGKVPKPEFDKYADFYLDLSDYRDINDILLIADCMITDYSSVIFDYVLLNKPIVYFTYDLDEYTGYGGRGLYFDFEEYVYGTVAKDKNQLIEAIKNEDLMMDKRKVFYEKFMGECDGHSTEKTCKWIFGENV